MGGGGGYARKGCANGRALADANRMTDRTWLQKHQAGRQGAQDARRIQSYVFSKAMANSIVTIPEAANLLARSRDFCTTKHGDTRPTQDEIQRARYALETLAKSNKSLRRYIDFRTTEGAHHEPQQS